METLKTDNFEILNWWNIIYIILKNELLLYYYYLLFKFVLLIDVKEVMPHFPTVPADLAADGRLLLSRKSLSNCILHDVILLFNFLLYDLAKLLDDIFLIEYPKIIRTYIFHLKKSI